MGWHEHGKRIGYLGFMAILVLATPNVLMSKTPSKASVAPPVPPLTINDLITIARYNQEGIGVLDFQFRMTQSLADTKANAELAQRSIAEASYSVLSTIDESRSYWRKKIRLYATPDPRPEVHLVSDKDKYNAIYTPEARTGVLMDTQLPRWAHKENEILSAGMLFPPQDSEKEEKDPDFDNLAALLKLGQLRKEIEEVDGQECSVVDIVINDLTVSTLWLDAGRGAAIRKRVDYGKNGAIVSTTQVHKLHEFMDTGGRSVWVPAEIEIYLEAAGLRVKKYVTLDVDKSRINPPITDKDFRIEFPPGTTVNDMQADISYVSGEGGIHSPDPTDLALLTTEQKGTPEPGAPRPDVGASRPVAEVADRADKPGELPRDVLPAQESDKWALVRGALLLLVSVLLLGCVLVWMRKRRAQTNPR